MRTPSRYSSARDGAVRRAHELGGFTPEGGLLDRDFNDGSASVGLLFRPAAANDKLTFAVNFARAARNPALEEVYFFGIHPGNFAFEIGNPELDSEVALGLDASVRWRHRRFTGEIAYFYNRIDDYIFRNPLTDEEFAERYPDIDTEGFPVVENVSATEAPPTRGTLRAGPAGRCGRPSRRPCWREPRPSPGPRTRECPV